MSFIDGILTQYNGSILESTSTEIEHEFFGYIDDIKEIEKMADNKTVILQPEIRTRDYGRLGAGSIRVRSYDDKKFILTIKSFGKENGVNAAQETEYEVDKSVFNAFNVLAPISIQKTRYSIKDPTNGSLTWEIDIPLIEGVEFYGCKIDLEVPSVDTKIPPFPFKVRDLIDKEKDSSKIGDIMKLFEVENTINIGQIKAPGKHIYS